MIYPVFKWSGLFTALYIRPFLPFFFFFLALPTIRVGWVPSRLEDEQSSSPRSVRKLQYLFYPSSGLDYLLLAYLSVSGGRWSFMPMHGCHSSLLSSQPGCHMTYATPPPGPLSCEGRFETSLRACLPFRFLSVPVPRISRAGSVKDSRLSPFFPNPTLWFSNALLPFFRIRLLSTLPSCPVKAADVPPLFFFFSFDTVQNRSPWLLSLPDL